MAKEVRLPQFGMTMESAEIVKWLRADGEFINKGEPLVQLLNDKATVEFEATDSGYLRVLASEGQELPVGSLLAVLLETKNENYTDSGS